VVSNSIVGPAYGHDAGYDDFYFERYKQGELDLTGTNVARPAFTADRVTDRALEWLEGARQPFFLHVHYTDPHEPYLAPEEWRERFAGPTSLPEGMLLGKRFMLNPRLPPEKVEALRRAYEAEIAFVDAEIGRLLAALPADTIVVFVADHGEEFFEHGGLLHGHTLFEEMLRVPLILAGPGIPEGVVVETPVSHVDVVPTILDLLGLPADGVTGRSLRPLFEGGPPPAESRAIFSMREKRPMRCVSVRLERWKLVRCGKRQPALYDLLEDPLEQSNVASQHEKVAADLVARLDRHERELRTLEAVHDPEGEEQRLRELRAIGYIE
jgi:arylsulfatase A-like enzyme